MFREGKAGNVRVSAALQVDLYFEVRATVHVRVRVCVRARRRRFGGDSYRNRRVHGENARARNNG